jgi:ABC-2 type transport system permease protein
MAVDKAIIISTHILEEVEALCSRAVIISNGQIVADGTPDELEHRSQYYNAVSVLLTSPHVETVHAGLAALTDVSAVEVRDAGEGKTTLLAIPKDGVDILARVSRLIRENTWHADEVRLERGHLDDVFRTITLDRAAHETSRDALTGARAVMAKQSRQGQDGTARTPLATNIHDVWSICRRELVGYFTTPVAYVFLVIFLASIGAFTFFLGKFFTAGQATLDAFFIFHPWLYLFLIPAIAMRLWAEERKSGSIELLLTLPVTTLSAVLGKFIAAWAVAGIGLVLTTSIWMSVNYLGSPDNGAIATSYIGSFFMAGGYLAIGSFVSAITRNQVIAFILAASLCFVFTASGLGVVLDFFSAWAPRAVLDIVVNLSFLQHFRDIARGVIDLRDVVFFLSTITFFLFANVVTVEYKKNG